MSGVRRVDAFYSCSDDGETSIGERKIINR